MAIEINFPLNTTLETFVMWLYDHTVGLDMREFHSTIEGYFRLHQAGKLSFWPHHGERSSIREQLRYCAEWSVEIIGDYIPAPGVSDVMLEDYSLPWEPVPDRVRKDFVAILFHVAAVTDKRILVTAECKVPEVADYLSELLRDIIRIWPEARGEIAEPRNLKVIRSVVSDAEWVEWETITEDGGAAKKRGPTIKTQERAKVFKRLKDKHPGWGYERVAMEAIDELEEVVTGETVRNAYRAMREAYPDQAEEWTWERADRVR